MVLADMLAQQFNYELGGTSEPFSYLLQTGRIRKETLIRCQKRGMQAGSASVASLLMKEAVLSLEEIGVSLERCHQVPFMRFSDSVDLPEELLGKLSKAYLQAQGWVPVRWDGEEAVILIDDPSDVRRIMDVERVVKARRYAYRVGVREDLLRFLERPASAKHVRGADVQRVLNELQQRQPVERPKPLPAPVPEEASEDSASVIQLVNKIIAMAYEKGASDIHIQPAKAPSKASVRLRIDGVCQEVLAIPGQFLRPVIARIKIISGMDISERRIPQDGKCLVHYRNRPIELRVATLPTVHGDEATVLRILAASEPMPMENLNLSARNLAETVRLTSMPHGIFLVVGPTGSGKTTTLHAVLGSINTPERIIWTAEDPVEITQKGLQQVQVNPKIGFDFKAALRAFLRADPDVIMIGEMRDHETASAGVEASLTGHLLLSTLHTNSAPETVTRMLDLGLDPISFSDALLGVLAQRLMRVLCKDCKRSYAVSEREFATLADLYGREQFSELKIRRQGLRLFKPHGCAACNGTGYKGRTGVHELLVKSDAMRDLIYRNATAAEIRAQAMEEGMRTLMQDGIAKILDGQSDFEQLRRVVGE